MSQHDYDIANQSFPAFRTDLNNVLGAINSSNSGTSRPSGAVAGTIWLDTTSATTPTLKFYDGADDISLATLDYSANTVNWLDSTVVFDIVGDTTPQLGGDLDVNGNSLVSVSNGDITFTPDGTGKVIIDGLSHPTSDGTTGQFLKTDGSGNLSFDDAGGGITMADQWRLTADTNSNTNADVTTNWERADTAGFNYIGTGLTESSGIFSFPQTGIYLITYTPRFVVDTDSMAEMRLYTTVDNSTFTIATSAAVGNNTGDVIIMNTSSQFIFDVINITNYKIKFDTSSMGVGTALQGDTSRNETNFTVIRLGDT